MATTLIAFRGRNDDGNETTATWKAAQNVNWIQALDQNFRVRFLVQNDTSALNNLDVQLQYNLNGAGWNNVTATSNVVRSSASPNLADQANLTSQLTGGTGVFEGATAFDEVNGICGGTSYDVAATEHFEHEFCCQLRSADVAPEDKIQLRSINSDTGTAWTTYNVIPEMTAPSIGAGANRGTNVESTSGTSLTVQPSGTVVVGRELFLVYCGNSNNDTDENSSEISSVTDTGSNVWTKQREFNNHETDFDRSVVTSVWKSKITAELTTASTITINLANTHVARAVTLREFAVAATKTLSLVANATDEAVDSGDFGSMVLSGLSSLERLYFRGAGISGDVAGVFSPTTNFTALTAITANGGGGALHRTVCGEFRINTSTGETSAPDTASTNGCASSVFLAYEAASEVTKSFLFPHQPAAMMPLLAM